MNVLVTVVAYNEALNCGAVIDEVRALGFRCIVIDDGSRDDTAKVAAAHGAEVVRHFQNLGQGRAILTAFRIASLVKCDAVAIMDGDGQHDPADLTHFIKLMQETGADVISGSRALGTNHGKATFIRRTFLPLLTRLLNRLSGYQFTDCMCGFRLYRRDVLERIRPILDEILEPQYMTPEMLIRFGRNGVRIVEAPVHLRDRQFGVSSKGLGRYAFGVARAIIRTHIS
jgi:glycosyltransferase involved in cell wall biosynthesis